jgi:putative ABC transport system substrate-binding protein
MNLPADAPDAQAQMAAFVQGLQGAGWEVGRNLRIESRWGGGDLALLRKNAADLIALNPDVILAGSGPTTPIMIAATRTVPIVFAQSIVPVGSGVCCGNPIPAPLPASGPSSRHSRARQWWS